MRIRLRALLCLSGLAACSNHTEQTTAKDPSYVEPVQAVNDAPLQPASLEPQKTPPSRPTTTNEAKRAPGSLPLAGFRAGPAQWACGAAVLVTA